MVRKKGDKIGFDPLSWMKEEDFEELQNAASETSPADSESLSPEEQAPQGRSESVKPKHAVAKKKVVKKKVATPKAAKKRAITQQHTANKNREEPVGMDIDLLESTFSALAPQADELVDRFYSRLLSEHSELQPLFASVDIASQKRKLVAALSLVINNLRNPEALGPALSEMGLRHQAYGVVAEHYPIVATTLLGVMKEMAGELWTVEVASAWEEALNTVANAMLDAYQEGKVEMAAKQEDLMAHVDLMNDILEHAPINIMIADLDENIVFVNKRSRDTLVELEGELSKYLPGFKAAEVLGGSIHRYHRDPGAIKAILAGLGRGDKRNGYITPGPFVFEHETRPLYNQSNEKVGYVVQWHDITKQRQEEEQAQRLQRAVDRAQTAMMMIDRDLTITYANNATTRLISKHNEALSKLYPAVDFTNLVGVCIDKFHADPSHQRRILNDPGNLPYETDIHVGPLTFHILVNAILDLKGEYVGCTLEWDDVTEVRAKEVEVARLTSAVEGSTTAMMMCDMDANITYANPAVISLLSRHQEALRQFFPGFEARTIVGSNIDQFHQNPAHQRRLIADPSKLPYTANIKVGAMEFRLTLSAIIDPQNQQIGCALEWVDITEEMDAQRQIENLINGAISGELDERIETSRYHGFMKDLGEGVNQLLDAVVIPLRETKRILQCMAENDLTQSMEGDYQGEFAVLQQAINGSISTLQSTVAEIRKSSKSISTASSEIAQGNTDLSQRTEEQAASLEETASSMEELTSTVKQNADNAREANSLASTTRQQAEKGGEVVGQAIEAMAEINNSSKKIADIIGVIDEIAFQTNLLALNAAVEAARAGEQGRGFAVVASEVRNLAQRSAGAAKEIKTLIKDSVTKVEDGTHLVDESGNTLQEIVTMVKKVSDIIAEIAAASQEQSSGIEQVNKAITHMDEATQQNAALVEEAAAASESLDEQCHSLDRMVRVFKLRDMGGDEYEESTPPPRAAPPVSSPATRVSPTPKIKSPVNKGTKRSDEDDEWEEF